MTSTADPIDHEALKRRYAQERDKRLRPDGPDQYLEPTGRYAHFVDDPYSTPTEREPKDDHVTFAIIGAGFAGLATGARLREAGIDDVRLIEGGGDVGGCEGGAATPRPGRPGHAGARLAHGRRQRGG